jgi:hypothetical protein
MIRVRYNDGTEEEYKTIKEAEFIISANLFVSQGQVVPQEVVEVMGATTDGVSVERVLSIKLGALELA